MALICERDYWYTQGFLWGRRAKKGQFIKFHETLPSYSTTSEWSGHSESGTWPKCAQNSRESAPSIPQCSNHDTAQNITIAMRANLLREHF